MKNVPMFYISIYSTFRIGKIIIIKKDKLDDA